MNYYNEIDKKAAAWLRQLILNGLIPLGIVDDRSIVDVTPSDLKGFTQHHFFAGIGGWSYALKLAGWPEDQQVCTASLPCQPFSTAGNQKGKSDERHLLPHFIELVKCCNFKTIFGEQVPGAIRYGWLDDLCLEMERENYAVGSIVLTAAGAGAPHIRQRLYWVADPFSDKKHEEQQRPTEIEGERGTNLPGGRFVDSGMGNATSQRQCRGESNSINEQSEMLRTGYEIDDVDWLYCRDNKCRPIKSSIKPLVDGVSERMVRSGNPGAPIDADNTQEARVMRLKGYGNAIVPQTAASFIKTVMDVWL